ncbi:MAG: DUF721 domain-containing protein [Cyclobacteriaceae bacterium]|jgi:predicted nucleic acid-binding Zn ribbon protein
MAKKGEEFQHVSSAIRHLLQSYRLAGRFDEANVVASWERLVGKSVARQTRKIFIRNRVLFVELQSAGLKHDLNLHKAQILDVLRKEFGQDAVQDLVLM